MAGAAAVPATGNRPKFWTSFAAIGLVAVCAGLLLPQLVPGEPPPAPVTESRSPGDLRYAAPTWPEPPNYQAMFLRLGLGTAAVLALCVGSLWYGKRWLTKLAVHSTTTGELTLVETLHLGNRCCLHLVRLPSRQVLVGSDPSGIKTVVPLPDVFEHALTIAQEEPTAPETTAA